jgi:alkanesulfonate monooxygenase SsuD/methylene tetrahydromethanopterin reductase-like flavin-dependent oxidoreductase (luciferase family)
LRGAAVGFAPAQAHVPLLVGGNGDRLLALAAQQADIVGLVGFTSGTGPVHTNLSHFSWAGLEDRIAHVRAHAGERFSMQELNVLVQLVRVGDRRALADELAEAFHRPAELMLDSPFVILGDGAAATEHLQRLRDLGVTYVVAFAERGAEDLAPAIAEIR